MNEYQQSLFNSLEALVASSEAFYRQEFTLGGDVYWIYNYRLASYTDFLQPGAMEARGVMFRVTNQVPELVSLPMSKFFNLGENPMTMNLDLTQVDNIQLKADGSLISTYLHNGVLMLKSKGSLFSEQAVAARKWLYEQDSEDQYVLRDFLQHAAAADITVNLEWTAPDNRVVIGYMEPRLTILNCRSMKDGTYVDVKDLAELYADGSTNWVERLMEYVIDEVEVDDPTSFVNSIPAMTDDIEGYVVKLNTGLWFKCKTLKYLSLHHAKDSVTNPRRLFEAVLDEGVDDLRSMFASDQLAIKIIDEMQQKVDKMYNHMVSLVEKYHTENKHLARKDYAIKAQTEVERLYFGLVMNKYLDAQMDYKGFLKSKWKDLGFKDAAITAE